jgi:hypothetical protein
MPNLDITISTPVLTAGQYFKKRHRLLPAGAWSSYTNRSNAQFTLTGLSVGTYEFEFIVVNADGSQCPVRSFTKEVKEFECMDVTVEQLNNPYRIKIAYALPPGGTMPPCGIQARYQDVAGGGWAAYNVTTNPYYIYPPNTTPSDWRVNVNALLCEGQYKSCFNQIVPKPEPVPCTPLSLNVQSIVFNGVDPSNSALTHFTAKLIVTQSNPPTLNTTVRIMQGASGHGMSMPPWQTSYPLTNMPATNFILTVQLQWAYYSSSPVPFWVFDLIDFCGNKRGTPIQWEGELIPKP